MRQHAAPLAQRLRLLHDTHAPMNDLPVFFQIFARMFALLGLGFALIFSNVEKEDAPESSAKAVPAKVEQPTVQVLAVPASTTPPVHSVPAVSH